MPADAPHPPIVRYGWRSLDRARLIQDNRLAARLRPPLWATHSEHQPFITSLLTGVLSAGPAAMASAYVPDLHHFRGSIGGKDVIALWRDAGGTLPNLPAAMLERLTELLAIPVTAQDLFAYTYGVLSAPAYVADFAEELSLPPPRLPITADAALFVDVAALGRRLLWLHTYGERFVPPGQVRGRVPPGRARSIKGIGAAGQACPEDFEWLPDQASRHDGVLRVGDGELGTVSREVWEFSVSGNHVLQSWLAFRMRNRSGKKSSPLDDIRAA